MSPTPSTPGPAAALAWPAVLIASAAAFLLLLDTTAMAAAWAPPMTHFSAVPAAVAVALVGHAGASVQQIQHLYTGLSGMGLLTAPSCLPVQARWGAAAAAQGTTATLAAP